MVVLKIFNSFFSGVKSTWVCGSQILAMVLGCLLHLMVFIIKGTSCKTNSWYVLFVPKYTVEIIYLTAVLMIGVWNTTNWEDTLAARVWFSSISEIVFRVGYDRILLSCVRNNWHINLGRLNNMLRQTLTFSEFMFNFKKWGIILNLQANKVFFAFLIIAVCRIVSHYIKCTVISLPRVYPRPVTGGLLFIKQGNGILLCDDNTKYEGEFVGECLLSGKVVIYDFMVECLHSSVKN